MKIRYLLLLFALTLPALAQQNALTVQHDYSAAGSAAWLPIAGYTSHTLTWSQVGSTTVTGCAVQVDGNSVNSGSGSAGGVVPSQSATTNGTITTTATSFSYARVTVTGCTAGTIRVTYSAVNAALSKGGGGSISGTSPIVVSGGVVSCPTCGTSLATVQSVAASGVNWPAWLTPSVTNPTTTPSLFVAATTGQTSHQVIGTCGTATAFAPCALVAGDIPTAIPIANIGSAGLSGTLPVSINSAGAISVANTNATYFPFQSLTTTGTSGASTVSGGVLNIPQYSGGPTLGTSAQVPVMNSGATAYAPQTITQDASVTAAGAWTNTGLKGVPFCTGFTPTTGQAIQYTTASSPNPCYTAVTLTGGGNVSASGTLANATPAYGGGTTNVSTAQTYVLASAMSGSDGAAKIAAAIASATYCPNTGNNVGCIIDARDMTGTDLIWKSNPFHGNNRAVTLLLGPHTYVACYPIVSGQNGYDVFGTGSSGSIAQDSIIRAGTAADGCAGDFPNGTSQLTFSWAHGPFAAGTYAGLYNDGGTPSTDTPTGTADTFGGRLEHLRLDCNNLATCSFGYFTSTEEERSGLYDVSISGVTNACGFWDRQYQIGQNNSGGGSGPTHFGFNDVTCSQPATGATTNTVYGFVYEGNTTHITFTGVGGGSGASAYVLINSGTDNPNSTGVVLNAGSGYPNGAGAVPCTLDAVVGSGSTCSATTDGSGHVVSIAFAGSPSGTYSGAQVPGGGFSFGKATITGTASIALAAGIWSEGSYNASISGPIHTERIGTDTVLIGGGTAPYQGTRVASVDTTTGSGGNGVHFGVGATDLSYTAENNMRLISSGPVLTDDNTNTVISTTTTPTIPFYTGGTIQSGAMKTNGNGVDAGYFALGRKHGELRGYGEHGRLHGADDYHLHRVGCTTSGGRPAGTQYLGCSGSGGPQRVHGIR